MLYRHLKSVIFIFIGFFSIISAEIVFAKNSLTCVTIGVIGEFKHPTKGYSRYFGKETLEGASIATKSLRNNYCFKLEPIETNNKLADIPFLIEKAAINKNIHLFIGLNTSEQAIIALSALKRTHSFLLSPTASDVAVKKSPYVISFSPSNKKITEEISKKMLRTGINRSMVIYTNNHYYSQETAKYFIEFFKQFGGTISLIIPVRSGNLDLMSFKEKLLLEKKLPVFLPDCDLDAAKIIVYLQSLGAGSTIIGSTSWSTYLKSVAEYLEHTKPHVSIKIIIPQISASQFHKKHALAFNDYFSNHRSNPPTDIVSFSYDSIFSIVNALNFCQKKESSSFENCLTQYGKKAFGDEKYMEAVIVFKSIIIKSSN